MDTTSGPEQTPQGEKISDEGPTEAFVNQAKDALEHMHDLAYLQQHPLASGNGLSRGRATPIAGQRLRWRLVEAVETLKPAGTVAFCALQARPYHLLTLHYVDGLTIEQTAGELGISSRQALRDLRKAEASVATVLWAQGNTHGVSAAGSLVEASSLQAEMARITTEPKPTDIRQLLQRVRQSIAPLAAQQRITLDLSYPDSAVVVSADALIAEQVLLSVLSRAVREAPGATLHIALRSRDGQTLLEMRYVPQSEGSRTMMPDRVVTELAERIGWSIVQQDGESGTHTGRVYTGGYGPTILVIDDNEGLVTLMKRFLTDQACQVISAGSGQEGLDVALEMVPDAVVLDVMMPRMHGWEVLQHLRTQPRTAHVPVIICSVIDDPELASALGASLHIAKPVTQADVLHALAEIDIL